MKLDRRNIGLAIFMTIAMFGVAHGQRDAVPIPVPPPQSTSGPNSAGPAELPQIPPTSGTPGQGELPSIPTPEKGPDAKAPVQGRDWEGELSSKDLIVDATEGHTEANPTGRQEPGISLEWLHPTNVHLGQPLTCTLIVKSLSMNRLHQVVVRYRVQPGATVRGTEPKAAAVDDFLVWQLGNFDPRQERRIDLHLVPTAKGKLPCHAFVTFTGSSTARLEVREPKLALKMAAPTQVLTGDLAAVAVTVSNPGDAKVEHVKVRVSLSDGLEYGASKTTDFNLEGLAASESRTMLVQCMAKSTGPQSCTAVASAEPGLEARGEAAVQVVAPRVDVAVSGPKMRYLDRHALYTLTVSNPGTATANHVTVSDIVPAGFKVVGASDGAHHDFAARTVVWFLGDLAPGHAKEVKLDLLAINPGEFKNQVVVTAARGLRTGSEAYTRIEGLPGLQMELVDLEDPVEMGKEMSYEVRLSNTGTKTETNLQLTCVMPERMEFRGARCSAGAPFRIQGREIVFAVIPKLAPRADIIFRVNVRSLAAGDIRFQARVRADGLETPVLREESTRVFGDEREGAIPPSNR
ncbi:MAG TPA: hypothetical protein VNX28_02770 [Gemmataceae bacterium]|nr:hypothetical protein [Gemmataceae bacterium]